VLTVSGELDDQQQERFCRADATASRVSRPKSNGGVCRWHLREAFAASTDMLFCSKPIEPYPQKNAAVAQFGRGTFWL
jgi:hypothetical protein